MGPVQNSSVPLERLIQIIRLPLNVKTALSLGFTFHRVRTIHAILRYSPVPPGQVMKITVLRLPVISVSCLDSTYQCSHTDSVLQINLAVFKETLMMIMTLELPVYHALQGRTLQRDLRGLVSSLHAIKGLLIQI